MVLRRSVTFWDVLWGILVFSHCFEGSWMSQTFSDVFVCSEAFGGDLMGSEQF